MKKGEIIYIVVFLIILVSSVTAVTEDDQPEGQIYDDLIDGSMKLFFYDPDTYTLTDEMPESLIRGKSYNFELWIKSNYLGNQFSGDVSFNNMLVLPYCDAVNCLWKNTGQLEVYSVGTSIKEDLDSAQLLDINTIPVATGDFNLILGPFSNDGGLNIPSIELDIPVVNCNTNDDCGSNSICGCGVCTDGPIMSITASSKFTGDPCEDEDESCDNCLGVANPDQNDYDGDGLGDLCDDDINGDGVDNNEDLIPCGDYSNFVDGLCGCVEGTVMNGSICLKDLNKDHVPDEFDLDCDSLENWLDNCPEVANPEQKDTDDDEIGDLCDEPDSEPVEKVISDDGSGLLGDLNGDEVVNSLDWDYFKGHTNLIWNELDKDVIILNSHLQAIRLVINNGE